MKVHLINPSALAFGVGVITPRWLYVLAAATPEEYGDPIMTDETLEPLGSDLRCRPATSSASAFIPATRFRGYEIGKKARARGAYVVFGGIHATLYPEEAAALGERACRRQRRRRPGVGRR